MKQMIFKQTEIGEIPEEWAFSVFNDVVEINPKRELEKKSLGRCIAMADLRPFEKKVVGFEVKEYKGGSRFANSDTLMARITPCLENGKTAYIDVLDESEVGFGSTEFIVLSSIEGKTKPQYVYYLARSPRIRAIAIKSMIGSSGRQRVQVDKLANTLVALPRVDEQERIVSVLSSLDDKIELNRRMNKTLEEIGKTLFRYWFVDFEFPNREGKPYKSSGGEMVDSELGEIPKGWEVKPLRDLVEYYIGGGWGQEKESPDHLIPAYVVRGTDIPNINVGNVTTCPFRFHKKSNFESRELRHLDIVIEVSGGSKGQPVGRTALIDKNILEQLGKKAICASFCKLLRINENLIDPSIVFWKIKLLYETDDIYRYQEQSTGISNFKFEYLLDDLKISVPSKRVSELAKIVFNETRNLRTYLGNQNRILGLTRDALLPRLMSGKLRVN